LKNKSTKDYLKCQLKLMILKLDDAKPMLKLISDKNNLQNLFEILINDKDTAY